MTKNKTTQAASIAILLALLTYSIAQACSPVDPMIFVKCSNMEVSIVADTTKTTADETYENFQKRWANDTIKNFRTIAPKCVEDLTPVLTFFEQEIVKWLDYKNKRGAFLDGDLILEPYSTDRVFELKKDKDNLLTCGYANYKHTGNWLIIFETSRPYCYTFWHTPGMCPSIILSLGHFLFYLVTSFSLTALPYLVGLLVAGLAIIYGWWKILKNRSAVKLWKVVALSIVVLIAELFMIVMPVWLFVQIIGWVSLFGIVVLWYKYFNVAKQKAG